MDEQRGSASSINFDLLSVGTANAQPIAVHHASLVDNAGTTPRTEYALPSPNFSRPSPLKSFSSRIENARPRPTSTGTMEDLRRPQPKRRSIIDPATVRLSFTGSVSDISSPLALPLEEGLQKLYKLYNEHTNPTTPLPHTLSITEVPLLTIADALSSHIDLQSIALLDCAQNLHAMTNLHKKLKNDLVVLEQHYSLAIEKGNIVAMSTEDVRRRLGWQIEEIVRINTEKEIAIKEAAFHKNEVQRLTDELQGMAEIMKENEDLRKERQTEEKDIERLRCEIELLKSELRDTKVELEKLPKPIKRLYGRLSEGDSSKERKRLERNRKGKMSDVRTGLLITATPRTSETYS